MKASVPTIIFDLGGVLIRHDNDLLHDRLAACCADPAAARPLMADALADEGLGTGRLGVEALCRLIQVLTDPPARKWLDLALDQ